MTRATFLPAALLLAAACGRDPTATADRTTARPATAADMAPAPSATGGVNVVFGPNVEHISFTASYDAQGRAIGEAEFHDATAHVNGHIVINCLRITGNVATLSGIVTHSTDATLEGFEALFQVQDNGEGANSPPDFSSTVLLHAVGVGPDCSVPSEFDLVAVDGGNVQVRQ